MRHRGRALRHRYSRHMGDGDAPVRPVRIDDKPTGECPYGCGRTAYAYVTSATGPSEGYVDACPTHAVDALVEAGLLSRDDAEALQARRGHARRYGRSEGSVYDRLVAAGCKIDNHESDLYVEATPEARAITAGEKNRSFFKSNVDGKMWIDIPFAYKPFWERKAR